MRIDRSRQDSTRIWMAVFAIAFVIRVLTAAVFGGFTRPELFEYDTLAQSLIAGRGFLYSHHGVPYYSYAAPLFSWICAGVYLVTGGSVVAMMAMQMLLSAANAALVAHIACRIFGRRAGVIAGLIMAAHPGLIVYSSLKAHALTLDALFFTIILWMFLRLHEYADVTRALQTGVAIGLGALTRGTSVVFLPLGVLWLFLSAGRGQRLKIIRTGSIVGLAAAVVVLPWVIRNTRLHGQFVFMVTTDAEVFWRGNNPLATGHSYRNGGVTVLDSLPRDMQTTLRGMGELEQARWFRDEAMRFIAAHPRAFVTLTLRKLASFWWRAPQTGILYPGAWLRAYMAFYVAILGLTAFSGWRIIRAGTTVQRDALLLVLFFVAALSLLQSLYYVEGRHRWAVEPMLILVAGHGASQLWSARFRKSGD